MREIKFRGKRKDNGVWVYGDLLHVDDKLIIIPNMNIDEIDVEKLEIIPETMGQYTGLCDMDGTRIYEGDIWGDSNWNQNYTVRYDECRAGWYPFADGDGCGCCQDETFEPDTRKVIGNIHDNPELLEVGEC